MTEDVERPVIVGFDGSPSSAAALEAAAAEAVMLGVPLLIVHAYVWPILYATLANVPYEPREWEPPSTVRSALAATAAGLAARHNGLSVQTRVLAGSGGPVLVGASSGARLLVVGGRGIGGVEGLLAGSVAPYVVSHAHCPVLIVRVGQSLDERAGPVVIGVDRTPDSRATLEYGCEWARRHGAEVEVLHAGPEGEPEASWLNEWVEAARRGRPGVAIHPAIVAGQASPALLGASRSASLVVVGTRNRGAIAGIVLGSVGQNLIRRCGCPVLVVREVPEPPDLEANVDGTTVDGTPPCLMTSD